MDGLYPRGIEKVRALMDKGVRIPNPLTLDVDDDVDVDRISGDGVTLHPGCRIRGASTVISAGVELGREGPVTVEGCRLGPGVALKGGYAAKATFLDGANLGLGHHVREGCLLEEESGGAHCVGLKQTILFPFVTLGSLINFCDALMAGGTSRSDHSEVGSSYIHFNFTPAGDKTTPSMFGEVTRGVMLRERPVFLGGQGGAVGPVRVAYGSVVGAGSVLRSDVVTEDTLSVVGMPSSMSVPFTPDAYRGLPRLLARNLTYLAHLDALEQWYRHVRAPFFARVDLGPLVAQGAVEAIASGRAERVARVRKLVAKLPGADDLQRAVAARTDDLLGGFGHVDVPAAASFVDEVARRAADGAPYLEAIRGLEPEQARAGTAWLQSVVDAQLARVVDAVPALDRALTR